MHAERKANGVQTQYSDYQREGVIVVHDFFALVQ